MALEEVRDAFGQRFINVGVAEQNMVGVAAGLAREGLKVFVYSIAPFCYARPFEQIRNDIVFANLSVCLVGNGGGYAYGYMGPTHHALEDCAVMTALGMRVLVPAFDEDIPPMLRDLRGPTYVRLGYDVRPKGSLVHEYASWRNILPGTKGVLAALGPLAGVAWSALIDIPIDQRPAVWAVTELPIASIPEEFMSGNEGKQLLFVVEEHVAAGGLGMQLLHAIALEGKSVGRFVHRHALGYPTDRYGSQEFHRKQCGLDAESICDLVKSVDRV